MDRQQTPSTPGAPASGSLPAASAETAQACVRAEQQAMRAGALAEDWRELTRRQTELQAALRKAVDEAEAERRTLDDARQALRDALAGLAADEHVSPPDAVTVRDLRQRVHEAAIQLALFERRHGHAGQGEIPLQALSFVELSRLGCAFLLPLALALLAASGIVAVALWLALGI